MDKKLSDNEIVKALDNDCLCVVYGVDCESCPLREKDCKILPEAIKDLIHRLQDENEDLKAKQKCHFELIDDKNEEICKQKAEIERLKENNEEQQRIIFGLEEEKQLLLKRLDEEFVSLKAVKAVENSPSAIKLLVKSIGCVQKDTAKEILDELDLYFKGTTFRKGYEFKKIEKKLKEIAERKGVEVE